MNRIWSSVFLLFTLSLNSAERIPTEELIEGIKSRDGRWFEVEIILFKRNDDDQLKEKFAQQVSRLDRRRQWDLIRQSQKPDLTLLLKQLPECYANKNPLSIDGLQPELFFEQWQTYQTLIYQKWQFTDQLCLLPNESLTGLWQVINQPPTIPLEQLTSVPQQDMPVKVVGGDHDDFHDVYLLAEQNLQLTSHFDKLKNLREITPLLHTGWRLPGLSKARALPMYLVAGKDFSQQFSYDGYPKISIDETPSNEELEQNEANLVSQDAPLLTESRAQVTQFMKELQQGAKIDFKTGKLVKKAVIEQPQHSYELDGFIKVHLDHYLYLEAQYNFRELTSKTIDLNTLIPKDELEFKAVEMGMMSQSSELDSNLAGLESTTEDNNESADSSYEFNYLKTFQFNQTRRLYSGDLHYLDHPKIGMLVQIRKYRH